MSLVLLRGYPRTWVPPSQDRGSPLRQESEYLLSSGRYASCGHAGGLSCFREFFGFSPAVITCPCNIEHSYNAIFTCYERTFTILSGTCFFCKKKKKIQHRERVVSLIFRLDDYCHSLNLYLRRVVRDPDFKKKRKKRKKYLFI